MSLRTCFLVQCDTVVILIGLPTNLKRSTHRPTIRDVAREAAVSIKTVSRVLNQESRVRARTRERVEAAMRELKYRPNTSARMLAGKRTYLLGLVYHENSSYIANLQNGAIGACRGEHYDLLIYPCQYGSRTLLDELEDLVTTPRVDGLVLTPPFSDMPSVRKRLRQLAAHYVAISRASASASEWSVATNDREICREMVAHLASLGHRRIAFVRGHHAHKAMQTRVLGFRDGMRAAGLRIAESLIVKGDNTFASGVAAGTRLLGLKNRPTAVFCANDHMAAGVMTVAHNLGLAVPRDLSIAGFDDLPLASQVWPRLTTVHQPLQQLGHHAVALLLHQIRGKTPDSTHRIVESRLMPGDSTGPVA